MNDMPKGRLLLVEPDAAMALELVELLVGGGNDVEVKSGLAEALEVIKDVEFDCAIIDVDLPETKGYEAARIIKVMAPDLPVIVTAGSNSKELETKVRDQDVFYYYLKSFDRKELKLAVRAALEKSTGKKGAEKTGRGETQVATRQSGTKGGEK